MPGSISDLLTSEAARNLSALYLHKKVKITCAFSGGPDSLALTGILAALGKAHPGLTLYALFLDHGLLNESDRESAKVIAEQACERFGIPLICGKTKPGFITKKARENKQSVEEAARNVRYRFLEYQTRKLGASCCALGHNREDNIQTLVMRFFQGSGAPGLCGIALKRDIFIRPLLSVSRNQILAYIKEQGLEYWKDPSNIQTNYLRNSVRYDLIPHIKSVFPGYENALENLAYKMSLTAQMIESQSKSLVWEKDEYGFSIRANQFFSAPQIVQLDSLYNIINKTLGKSAGKVRFSALKSVLEKNPKKDGVLFKYKNHTLFKKNNTLFWQRDIVSKEKKRYFIIIQDTGYYFFADKRFFVKKCSGICSKELCLELEYSSIKFPLILRSRNTGDRINTCAGEKSIKKLFNQWRIPVEKRDSIPVVQDRLGIVAVWGEPFGFPTFLSKRFMKQAHHNSDKLFFTL